MSKKVAFGGGCHWCTEAIFQTLKGVERVEQGWVQSDPPHDDYSEAVVVHYDSDIIALSTMIEIHLYTHSSTVNHPLRKKYRSAIYYLDELTREKSISKLNQLKTQDQKDYITQVLRLVQFKLNDEKFLDYYRKQPDAPFCRAYIDPKLKQLRELHRAYLT